MRGARLFAFLVLVLMALGMSATGQVNSWSLAGDWSDVANPGDVWAYGVVSQVDSSWSSLTYLVDSWPVVPGNKVWGTPGGNNLPCMYKSSVGSYDIPIGRTAGYDPTQGNGWVAARWTAPNDVNLNIAGGTWLGYDDGSRTQALTIWVNGTKLLDDVNIPLRGAATSSAPFSLISAAAAAGKTASDLQDIAVSAGQTIILGIRSTGSNGTILGIDFNLDNVTKPAVFSPPPGVFSTTQSVTITSGTSGATIRYTTDGSEPSTGSTLYSGAITVSATTTIKAKTFSSSALPGNTRTATYVIGTAQPVFTPDGGTYHDAQTVSITCASAGATIYYTTDNSEPTASSPVYSSPLVISSPLTLKAKAWTPGNGWSPTKTATYDFYTDTPTFAPDGGIFEAAPVSVTVSCATAGATIRYTTDGSDPDTSSTVIASGSSVSIDASMTLKAKAWAVGLQPSDINSANYVFSTAWTLNGDWSDVINPNYPWTYGVLKADSTWMTLLPHTTNWPVTGDSIWGSYLPCMYKSTTGLFDIPVGTTGGFTPNLNEGNLSAKWTAPYDMDIDIMGGVWLGFDDVGRTQAVSLLLDGAAIINRVTIPGVGSASSSAPFSLVDAATAAGTGAYVMEKVPVLAGQNLILGIASVSPNGGTIVGMDFSITNATPPGSARAPQFSPSPGAYSFSQYVTITSPQSGAVMRYTTDGSEPGVGSTVYSGPVHLSQTATIKAKAWKTGLNPSETNSAPYTISGSGTWNLTADWKDHVLPSTGIGPDGVWAYGYDTAGGVGAFNFQPFRQWGHNYAGFGYMDPPAFGGELFGMNLIPYMLDYPDYCPENTIRMHTAPASVPLIIRWTAPASITVTTSGSAYDGHDYDYYPAPQRPEQFGLRKNNESDVWTAISSTMGDIKQFDNVSFDVNRGDVLYFWFKPTVGGGFTGCGGWTISSLGAERTAAPSLSPPGGVYFAPAPVSVSCVDTDATIRYTTNGSDPTESSTAIANGGVINVSSNMTLKAKAFSVLSPSSTIAATYVLTVEKLLSEIKAMPTQDSAGADGVVVTAKFGSDAFYVEEPDRSSGIQVRMPGNTASVGRTVAIFGVPKTDSTTGERYIEGSYVRDEGPGSISPVAMNARTLGGSPAGPQEGITGASGRNNIGLLVTIYGRVSQPGTNDFYLDDGSGVSVHVVLPDGVTLQSGAEYVAVTGISACEKVGGNTSRLLKATGAPTVYLPAP